MSTQGPGRTPGDINGAPKPPSRVRRVRRVRVVRTSTDEREASQVPQPEVTPAVQSAAPVREAGASQKPTVRRTVRRKVVVGAAHGSDAVAGAAKPSAPSGGAGAVQGTTKKVIRRVVVRTKGRPRRETVRPAQVPQIPSDEVLAGSVGVPTAPARGLERVEPYGQPPASLPDWVADKTWEEDLERWATGTDVSVVADTDQKGARTAAQRRRPRVFWTFYVALLVVMAGGIGYWLVHTYDSLLRYEESQPQVYMEHFVADLSKGGSAARARKSEVIDEDALSPYDSVALLDERFEAGVGKAPDAYRIEMGGKSFDANSPVYTVFVDDEPYLSVHMVSGDSYTRLSLLTITDWSIESSILYGQGMPEDADELVDEGLTYTISVQDSSRVSVNGKVVGDESLSDEKAVLEGFEYAAQFVDPPEAVSYVLEGLHTSPKVEVADFEGNEVEMTQTGYSYTASMLTESNRTAQDLPIDVLDVAERWSLFMSDMLGGYNHGLAEVTASLVPGSELYQQAESFASSVDITFVTGGVFTGFTEESVTNCVMYNNRLFSCDVHFIKNIIHASSGQERPDEFDNRMIFAYIDTDEVPTAGWYLVNMQALTEEDD